jgi:hypothetical protein
VNPETTGFVLQNLKHNKPSLLYGAGEEVYFALLKTGRYSLRLQGAEVWSYGEAPNMGLGPSPVSHPLFFSLRVLNAIANWQEQEVGCHQQRNYLYITDALHC